MAKHLYYSADRNRFFISPVEFSDGTRTTRVSADQVPAGVQIKTGLSYATSRPSMDFETFSEAGFIVDRESKTVVSAAGPGKKGGLGVVGTPNYACHPTTDVICLYYDLKRGEGRKAWIPGGPLPHDLIEHVRNGGDIEAFNMTFEWWIWNTVCVRKYGFPPMRLEQTYCVMAKARRHSLPGALDNVAKALGTAPKDKEGGRLIQKLCRPHKPTKKRQSFRWTPADAWEDFVAMYKYCDQDVATEDDANARIPDLSSDERATWLADQRVNARGVNVDIQSLDCMIDLLGQTERRFTMELAQITQGAVESVSKVAKILDWMRSRGFELYDLTADTVKEKLAKFDKLTEACANPAKMQDLHPVDQQDAWKYGRYGGDVRRVLQIRQALGSANIKKLRTLKLQVSSDGRLRDQYMYCGADRTGRWSAGGVQLQNITAKGVASQKCNDCGRITGKGHKLVVMGTEGACPDCGSNNIAVCPEWTVEAVEFALADIRSRDIDEVIALWGDPVPLMCGCLRGLFMAPKGKQLMCSDFSAIEAVVLACVSRCQWRIDVFNDHGKIYEMSASRITGTPFEEYMAYKKANGMHHPDRKKIGKVAELASGYGGWVGAWKAFGADEHFSSDAEIEEKIIAWRDASPEIVEFWGGQHRQVGAKPWNSVPQLFGLEGAAVAAIQNPGQRFTVTDFTFGVHEGIMYVQLPSGRFLHYHEPELHDDTDPLRRPIKKITFMGYNSNAQKGPVGWCRMETYGGRLCENLVQAVSADIQADAMKRAEAAGFPVVMHTHDELTTEVELAAGRNIDELNAVMSVRPAWASWWPIKAAGWAHERYQKD